MTPFKKCFYCGVLLTYEISEKHKVKRSFSTDHIFPKRLRKIRVDGKQVISYRTVLSCVSCNNKKSDSFPGDFILTLPEQRWTLVDWDFLYDLFGASEETIGGDFWNYQFISDNENAMVSA